MLLGVLLPVAFAGYGDAVDTYPWPSERVLHLWTNGARVDPEAFEADYNAGDCSFYEDFSADEQTPKHPVLWSHDLNEAARFHTTDMLENDWFAHESSDGTTFPDRLARYYDSPSVGENIAVGYGDEYAVVFTGWMCSTSGHRANIMDGGWDELGVGTEATYYTQDFGTSGVGQRAVTMGAHLPLEPSGTVDLWGDSWNEEDIGPEAYIAVVDGVPYDLALVYGETYRGLWRVTIDVADGCHEYFLEATWGEEVVRFPENGSYGFGDCAFDDAEAGWFDRQMGVAGQDDLDEDALRDLWTLVGCNTSGAPGFGLASVAAAVFGLRRRRR
jgi:uncharacterized protein (TIGR03382 family)